MLVAGSLWCVKFMLVRMWFFNFILTEMHMFTNVHVCWSLNIFVFVFVQLYVCVSGFLLACAYRKVVLMQSSAACPPSGSARLPWSSQAGTS